MRSRRTRLFRRSASGSTGPAAGRPTGTRCGARSGAVHGLRRPAARRRGRSVQGAPTVPTGRSSAGSRTCRTAATRRTRPGQTDWELDVSHWTAPIAQFELHSDWAFDGEAHNLFGRLTYGGVPVYGFHTVKGTGAPQDRYGRSLYIDTLDSAYGPGGSARRRSSSAIRPVSSATRSGRRTTCRCRAGRLARQGTGARTGSPFSGPA